MLILGVAYSAAAQDIITKTDGTTIEAKVVEILPDLVKYKKFNNLDGPLYTITLAEVVSIAYPNGTVEIFNVVAAPVATPAPAPSSYVIQDQTVTDRQLLAVYGGDEMSWEKYNRRAKTYRWIGGIGAAVFVAGGIVAILATDDSSNAERCDIIGGVAIGVGVLGGAACFIAAHHQANKAKELRNYELLSTPALNFGQQRLSASLNVMNSADRTAYGLGIGVNFTF